MIFDMLKRLRSVVYLPNDYVCKKVSCAGGGGRGVEERWEDGGWVRLQGLRGCLLTHHRSPTTEEVSCPGSL